MNLGHRFQGQERQGFFPIGKEKKGLPCNAGDAASIGKIPWGRKWQPSILAWKIPWTEEPGGLQSMGLQKSLT